MKRDDVRSSLDLLDSVIGEFDDGVTSSAESEYNNSNNNNRRGSSNSNNGSRYRAPTPPKEDSRKKGNLKSKANSSSSNGNNISSQIDDIFSEATGEVSKKGNKNKRHSKTPDKKRRGSPPPSELKGQNRQRSPVRHVNDPLPVPPQEPHIPPPPPPPPALPGVVSRLAGADSDEDGVVLKSAVTSVKAQVHSLEQAKNNRGRSQGKTDNTPVNRRSRSEAPGASKWQQVARDNVIKVEVPPPMPEKTRIHLVKAAGERPANRSELKGKKGSASGVSKAVARSQSSKPFQTSIPHTNFGDELSSRRSASPEMKKKTRKTRASPESSVVSQKTGLSSSNAYESVPSLVTTSSNISGNVNNRGPRSSASSSSALSKAKRSRSMGALQAEDEDEDVYETRVDNHGRRGGLRMAMEQRSRQKQQQQNFQHHHPQSFRLPQPPPDHHLAPRFPHVGKSPMRQKSMIDLREPWVGEAQPFYPQPHPQQHLWQQQQQHQKQNKDGKKKRWSLNLVRSATEHDIRLGKHRTSPPKQLSSQQQQQQQFSQLQLDELPPMLRRQMMQQQAAAHAAEAAAATLSPSAFPPSPQNGGQNAPVPPEQLLLHRQLTLEAQREFLLRRGGAAFSPAHPFISGEVDVHPELQGRLPFQAGSGGAPSRTIPLRPEDYQRFKPELWVRRGHTPGRPVSFNDPALLRSELELRRRRELQRQHSQRAGSEEGDPESFNSLPWEEIVLNENLTTFEEQGRKRQQMKKKKAENNQGWFSSNSHPRTSAADEEGGVVRKVSDHWLLKERRAEESLHQIQSMPPAVNDTLRDSGIGDESNVAHHLSRNGTGRSSFGIVLKDKFQKNTRYLPHDGAKSKRVEDDEDYDDDDMVESDDTLIHDMSEGSFEHNKSNKVAGDSSTNGSSSLGHSSASPHNSMEGSPRMVAKSSNDGVSMTKKTIRNYTPRDSGNVMLRVIEDNRRRRQQSNSKLSSSEEREIEDANDRKSSVERMIDDFHKNLPPPPSTTTNTAKTTLAKKNFGNHHEDTLCSRVSNWSEASFDYQPASMSGRNRSKTAMMPAVEEATTLSPRVSPEGERIPPEGADDEEEFGKLPQARNNFVHRIQVTAEVNTPPPTSSSSPSQKRSQQKEGSDGRGRSRKKEVKKKVEEPAQKALPQNSNKVEEEQEEDEFANLHKLLREGRIAGLNEKPPSFVPPTPPSVAKKTTTPPKTANSAAKRRSSSKPPAPARPLTAQQRSQSQTREVGSKKPAAPQPPTATSSTVREREGGSVEDLTQMDAPGRRAMNKGALVNGAKVRRTPSSHETKPRSEQRRAESMHMAQLIADSTERKFSLNPFKGMWKKKHYSFDFN